MTTMFSFPSLRLTGRHGGHLLCSEQDTTGPTSRACAVIQPGPTQRYEETYIHTVVVASQACPLASACHPAPSQSHRRHTWVLVLGHLRDHESSTNMDLPLAVSVFPLQP